MTCPRGVLSFCRNNLSHRLRLLTAGGKSEVETVRGTNILNVISRGEQRPEENESRGQRTGDIDVLGVAMKAGRGWSCEGAGSEQRPEHLVCPQ